MPAGLRYKFQGSKIALLTGFTGVALTISSISRTNPAVITFSGGSPKDGDVVQLADIGGMTEIDGGTYALGNVTATTAELIGVDATGYAAYTTGGTATMAVFSNMCELTDYSRKGGSRPELPATSLCSTAAEFELGMVDYGTTDLSYLFALKSPFQQALFAAETSGDIVAVLVELPKLGGRMVQFGFVQTSSEQASNGGMWSGQATLRNTGPQMRFEVK